MNDYLQAFDDQINLSDGTVRSLRAGKELISKRTIIVTVPNILFVVDCSESPPAPPQQGLRVEKRAEDTMLSVGPFWIQGQIHIPTAGNINSFMRGGAGSFVPVTDVRISGHEQHNGRTVLVNRTHIRCLLL